MNRTCSNNTHVKQKSQLSLFYGFSDMSEVDIDYFSDTVCTVILFLIIMIM